MPGLYMKLLAGKSQDAESLPDDTVIALITNNSSDSDSEAVLYDGIDLSDYVRNPVILFHHGLEKLPVGKAVWTKPDRLGKGLVQKIVFDMEDPLGAAICRKMKKDFVRAFSIGILPVEEGPPTAEERLAHPEWGATVKNVVRRSVLKEVSVTAVGANPDALVLAKAFDKPEEDKEEPEGDKPGIKTKIKKEEQDPDLEEALDESDATNVDEVPDKGTLISEPPDKVAVKDLSAGSGAAGGFTVPVEAAAQKEPEKSKPKVPAKKKLSKAQIDREVDRFFPAYFQRYLESPQGRKHLEKSIQTAFEVKVLGKV